MTEKQPERTENQNGETIVAYKGFDKDFKCRDFQYEVGGEYTHKGPVNACESGFHACEHPLDVFSYYPPSRSRFAVVEQSGGLSRGGRDTKVASRHIRIRLEIGIADLVKAAVEYVSSRCKPLGADSPESATGYRGAAAATGDQGAASATGDLGAAAATGDHGAASATGDWGAASATGDQGAALATGYQGAASATGDQGAAAATGNQGAASATGDWGAASATGYQGAASATGDQGAAAATGEHGAALATGYQGAALATGNCGAALATSVCGAASAMGQRSVALASGWQGRAKGGRGCALFLVYRETEDGSILHAKAVIVGQGGIKPDTWYCLDDEGEIKIAKQGADYCPD